MSVIIIMPGFGLQVIDREALVLQPWNYLLQIAENLKTRGYTVKVLFVNVTITNDVRRELTNKGIIAEYFNRYYITSADAVVSPISVKFFTKIAKLLTEYKGPKVIGVLTSPLMDLSTLFLNYLKVKTTHTAVAIDAVLYENILFRLKANAMHRISEFIVPSNDYINLLSKLIPHSVNIVKFMPQVTLSDIESKDEYDKHFTIAYFGPYSEERGVVSLTEAFRKLCKEHEKKLNMIMLIRNIGSRRINHLLKSLKKFKDRILLHIGYLNRTTLFRILSMSKLIVLPYRITPSTVPLAFLEALMLRRPMVISTAVPGVNEHIKKYLPCYLEPSYSVDHLKKIIADYLESDAYFRKTLARQIVYATILREYTLMQQLELDL